MNKDKAVELLALGLAPSQVASVVGVSPGRISQLLSDPDIRDKIALKELEKANTNEEEQRIEAKLLAVKNNLLNTITGRTNEATFMELARAFEIICRAESLKKNPVPVAGAQIFNGLTVQIAMPQRNLTQEIQITNDREVIAVGNRALAPLPASQVTELFGRLR